MEAENMHTPLHIAGLIGRYALGQLEPAELQELEAWLNTSAENKELFRDLLNEAELERLGAEYKAINTAAASAATKRRLSFTDEKKKPSGSIRLWTRIAGIAAALTIITAGLWFYAGNHTVDMDFTEHHAVGNGIKPGKNTATLLLANGKTITLSDAKAGIIINPAKLTYSDGSGVHPGSAAGEGWNSDQKLMAVVTPRGGTYQVVLPDGTKAWLNAASELIFPVRFSGNIRKIELRGEAYFEVVKDKKRPFIVAAGKTEVEVLGTHFNINAYVDEGNVKTTLLEGSVKINDKVLIPNQQAITNGNAIDIKQINPDEAVAWKNGEFMFNNEPLGSIMKQIGRWYDVEVEYKDPFLSKKVFGGTINRFANASDVLQMLELTGDVHFKIEGRRIVVTK